MSMPSPVLGPRLTRVIVALRTDDPGAEDAAATRARLKERFPAGAVRRMTRLGLLVGAALGALEPGEEDSLVYATQFGECRALEDFLASFPAASPTLFQTSIHPSGVQQALIGRQRAVREVLPLAGEKNLVGQALLAALLSPAPRALLAGGEERGTWLVAERAASERTFAYALALVAEPLPAGVAALGRVSLVQDGSVAPADSPTGVAPGAWFDLLHTRTPFRGPAAPGWELELSWT